MLSRTLGTLVRGDVICDLPTLGVVDHVKISAAARYARVTFKGGMTLTGSPAEPFDVWPAQ
jgi:hypothetical protein